MIIDDSLKLKKKKKSISQKINKLIVINMQSPKIPQTPSTCKNLWNSSIQPQITFTKFSRYSIN